MKNNIIAELKKIQESLNIIIDLVNQNEEKITTDNQNGGENQSNDVEPEFVKKAVRAGKTLKKEEPVEEETNTPDFSEMSYIDLKKYCKQLGISGAGSRDDLLERIAEFNNSEKEEEPVEEQPPVPKKEKPSKKLGKVEKEPEPDEEDDGLYEKVKEYVKEYTNEELADILVEYGLKAKGKRESLLSELVKAVREGIIVLEDDTDEGENGESEVIDSTAVEVSETEEETSSDDTVTMTKERERAISEKEKEIVYQYEEGEIPEEDLRDWYSDYIESETKAKKEKIETIIQKYVDYLSLFIDDDGVEHEEKDPYFINEEPYCCGCLLEYDEDKNSYVCPECGSEYEAE